MAELSYHYIKLINDPVIILDTKFHIRYINPEAEKTFGYSLKEILDKRMIEIIPIEYMNDSAESMVRQLNENNSWRGEVLTKDRHGTKMYHSVTISSIRDDKGNTEGYLGFHRDISLEKEAIEAIKVSENKFRSLFNNANDGIVLLTEDVIYDCNQKILQLLDYTRDAFIGKHPLEISPEYQPNGKKSEEEARIYIENAFKGNSQLFEWEHVDSKGAVIPFEISLSAVDIGEEKEVLMAFMRDMRERKTAEKTIKEKDSQIQEITGKIPGIVYQFVATPTGEYSFPYVSEGCEVHFVYTAKEVMANPMLFYERMHPEDRNVFQAAVIRSIASLNQFDLEIRFKTKDDSYKWLKAISDPSRNDDGSTLWSGIAIDINKQKEAEEALTIAKEKAEESDRLKSAFLATMSHELRTPLNAVIGFSDLINDKMDFEEVLEYIKVINDNGQQLLQIIESLFDISTLETEDGGINNDTFDIVFLFSELQQLLKNHLLRAGKDYIATNFIKPKSITTLSIKTDKIKLKQLLTNFLNNAVKFTIEGEIEFGFEIEGADILFFVKDSGIGIPIEKQNIIFEKFRQVDDSHTREFGGIGLGLAICKKIADLLGGQVWVESEKGEGSIFYFKLKNCLDHTKEQSMEELNANQKLDLSSKTILVAEDEHSNYYLLEVILKKLNANILWAKDGFEAINMYQDNSMVDLILMDIKMPNLNGYEATRKIREHDKNIPIIAATAYAMAGDDKTALEAGCTEYISKPIKRKKLLEILERYMA